MIGLGGPDLAGLSKGLPTIWQEPMRERSRPLRFAQPKATLRDLRRSAMLDLVSSWLLWDTPADDVFIVSVRCGIGDRVEARAAGSKITRRCV